MWKGGLDELYPFQARISSVVVTLETTAFADLASRFLSEGLVLLLRVPLLMELGNIQGFINNLE